MMEPDIHLRKLHQAIKHVDLDVWVYPTVCGTHVQSYLLVHHMNDIRYEEPTCMGCILVRFQERAEKHV
jgi:hypothetical protein